jgi:hypothetical protein
MANNAPTLGNTVTAPVLTEEQQELATKRFYQGVLAKKLGTQLGLAVGHSLLKKRLLAKSRAANAASTNPELAAKLQQIAKDRFGLKTTVVRADNASTHNAGPEYMPAHDSVVGPSAAGIAINQADLAAQAAKQKARPLLRRALHSMLGQKVRPLIGTLDDPSVIAHELGHAVVAQQTPWIHGTRPAITYVSHLVGAHASMTQSPTLSALMALTRNAPSLLEERRANMVAKKLLQQAVGRTEAQRLLKSNRYVEASSAAKTMADVVSSYVMSRPIIRP